MRSLVKWMSIVVCVLAGWLAGGTRAAADPIQAFNANVSGTFGNGSCATCTAAGSTITSAGGAGSSTITFSSNSPELVATLAPGQSAFVTLGVLNATSTVASGTGGPSFTGATFTLNISFTVPNDASPNPGVFSGTLSGQIVQGASSTFIQWAGPTTLTFTSPTAGTFTLMIESFTPVNTPSDPNNTRVRALLTYTAAPIPEPATLLLLSTSLLGVASLAKRKAKGKAA